VETPLLDDMVMSDNAMNKWERAEWIWTHSPRRENIGLIPHGTADFECDKNRYVYFRKRFNLSDDIESGSAKVSADGRYQLFLNGIQVGRGPARCHPEWQYTDSYSIAHLLKPGVNVFAALVHSYGCDTSWYELPRGSQAILFGCSGFYLSAEIKTRKDSVFICTDESWKFLISQAWEQETPFSGTGFEEHYDLHADPGNWSERGFDDSMWESAYVQRIIFPFGGSDIVPFPRLVERDIPHLEEAVVRPVNIHSRLDLGVMIYDFGRILIGRPHFEIDADDDGVIRITSSEVLDDTNGMIPYRGGIPGISAPLTHVLKYRKGKNSYSLFDPLGFRFLQISQKEFPRPLLRISVRVEESRYPMNVQKGIGSFSCSDDTLTSIWKAGAYTAVVCRQDGFIDCPSREQRQWTGDIWIQSLINYVTSGDTGLVRKSLLQSAQTQRSDGMIMPASTCDIRIDGRTYIPDYALYWILSIDDYIRYSGDKTIIPVLFPSLIKAVTWFISYIDANGLLSNIPGWVFIDWSENLDKRGEVLVLNALFVAALRSAARIAGLVGGSAYEQEWMALASSIAEMCDRTFWNETKGVYIDARNEIGPSPIISQHGNAAAVACGICPREHWDKVFSAILDEKKLKLTKAWSWDIERPFDANHDVILAQPFFMRWLHAALARAGRKADIVENIKKRWSAMIKDEGSTFWETWQATEMTSHCHAFSATPTYDISTYVLGVYPVEDGYSQFRITPYFLGLDWVCGEVPTPAGNIVIAWKRQGDSLFIDISVPFPLSGVLEVLRQNGAYIHGNRKKILTPGNHHFVLRSS